MHATPVAIIGAALLAGMLAITIAARLRVPAIVLLLGIGAALGPSGLGLMSPTPLGNGLTVLTEIAISLILFEGAISLRSAHLRGNAGTIRNLLTIGAAMTFVGASGAAHWVLGMTPAHAAIVGSILVVTGPTVVTPLLGHIRPQYRLANILRWEGILIDPIGALAAVVVLDLAMRPDTATVANVLGLYALSAIAGSAVGLAGALLLDGLFRLPGFVEERLRGPLAIAVAIAVSGAAEQIGPNSGLFAATVAGLVLMWRKSSGLEEVERLMLAVTNLLLALLFVLLSQLVDLRDVVALGHRAVAFLVAIIGVRAVSVWCATLGAGFSLGQRAFLAWVAPRGVVAASVGSLFAARLAAAGDTRAHEVSAVVFFVICATITIQGLTARPLARLLGVLAPPPRAVLIVGAGLFGRALARALADLSWPVTLVDKNPTKLEDLGAVPVIAADAHDLDQMPDVDHAALAIVLAATSNDEANALACLAFQHELPSGAVVQVPASAATLRRGTGHVATRFPYAFGDRLTVEVIDGALSAGGRVRTVEVETATRAAELRRRLGSDFRPMIELGPTGPRFVTVRNALLSARSRVIGVEGFTVEVESEDVEFGATVQGGDAEPD